MGDVLGRVKTIFTRKMVVSMPSEEQPTVPKKPDIRELISQRYHCVDDELPACIHNVRQRLQSLVVNNKDEQETLEHLLSLSHEKVLIEARKLLRATYFNPYLTDIEKHTVLTEDPPHQYVMEVYENLAEAGMIRIQNARRAELFQRNRVETKRLMMERKAMQRAERIARTQAENDEARRFAKEQKAAKRAAKELADKEAKAQKAILRAKQQEDLALAQINAVRDQAVRQEQLRAEKELLLGTVTRVAKDLSVFYPGYLQSFLATNEVELDVGKYLAEISVRDVTINIVKRLSNATANHRLNELEETPEAMTHRALEDIGREWVSE